MESEYNFSMHQNPEAAGRYATEHGKEGWTMLHTNLAISTPAPGPGVPPGATVGLILLVMVRHTRPPAH
jgi:hypothetical protein